MPTWSRGRTVLLGDAAFCPSLLAGEGAGSQWQARTFLQENCNVQTASTCKPFEKYEQQFRPLIERKQSSAKRFASSFAPGTHLWLFVRDLVLRSASLPFVSDWLMRSFVVDNFELPEFADLRSRAETWDVSFGTLA